MKCYTTLFLALGIAGQVKAGPVAPICNVVRFGLALDRNSGSRATTYCSSLLGIKTKTVTTTQITTTSTTVQETTTAATAVTIAAAAVTLTDTATQTSTDVKTDTATTTVTAATSTETSSVTSGTTTSTTVVCSPPPAANKRDDHQVARGLQLARPAAWNSLATSLLSPACSCLSLTTPTFTAQAQSTASTIIIQTSTVTSTTTTTPTIYATVTTVTYLTSTVTTTMTSEVIPKTTTTVTVPSIIATATNNVCNAGNNNGNFRFVVNEEVSGDGVILGDLPQLGFSTAFDKDDRSIYPILTVRQQTGRIYAVKKQEEPFAAPEPIMYVMDGVLGGYVYFASPGYVASNGYFPLPCEMPGYNRYFLNVLCYNSAGVRFTAGVDRLRGKVLMYTGPQPSGAVNLWIGLQARLDR